MPAPRASLRRLLAALPAVLCLAACGGGGGSAAPPPPAGVGPADHTVWLGAPAIAHGEGHDAPLAACGDCHGGSLEGAGDAPACASCHADFGAVAGGDIWDAEGCGACHGAGGEGGFAPDVRCLSGTVFAATLREEGLAHLGGTRPAMSDRDLAAMTAFVGSGACPEGRRAPPSHTIPQGAGGFLHHPGLDTPLASCTACHGPALEGYRGIPSCASCHGDSGTPSTGCAGCHTNAQDNGDQLPIGGRRGVMAEFALQSHHLHGTELDETDCTVCHDMSAHRGGKVRLLDVDAPTDATAVIVLDGDPASDATEAAKLTGFCLACHDADGADGSAPFSDGVTPAVIDKTAWEASKHYAESLSCFGTGTTPGCHSSGHGAANPALLRGAYALTQKQTYTAGDYQACWDCHSESGTTLDSNAFEKLHKKHVREKGYACVNCHDVHHPHDSGERGLISFDHALDNGFSISLLAGDSRSDAYWVNAAISRAYCAIKCHGETHNPEDYVYDGSGD